MFFLLVGSECGVVEACIARELGGGGADRRTRGTCDGSGELSGRSHKQNYAKISSCQI